MMTTTTLAQPLATATCDDAVATRRSRPVLVLALGLVVALLFPVFVSTASAQARGVTRTAAERSISAAVTSLLNSERKANHLRALRPNNRLVSSARGHNLAMARTDTMSHQVRGESELGRRIDAVGYHWMWNGENIGVNSRMTQAGVLTLQKAMYNERAPYNGHRLNILNSHFRNVGVDVYLDQAHHKVWLTVDFGSK